jgi:hypothetical protein
MIAKNLILASLILVVFGCKKSNSDNPITPPNPIGEKLFNPGDSTGSSDVWGVSKSSDNNIIISGTKDLFNSSVGYVSYYPLRFTVDYSSFKIISSGAPLLNKYGTAVQSKQSGNFIYTLINLTNSNGEPVNKIEVIKTDTSNNIVWDKTFDNVTMATCLELLSNGNLLIEGNYGSDQTSSTNTMVLISLDKNGNTIFNKQYTNQFYSGCYDIIEEQNDYALIAFNLENSSVYSNILKPCLLKINFNGNIISSMPFNNFFPGGSGHYFTSFHLRKNMQSGYVLTSTFVDTSGGVVNENFFLNVLNHDGAISKSANLWIGGIRVFRVADVMQTQNGNIYALVCLDTGTDYVTEIIQYNAEGNYLNSKDICMDRYPEGLVEAENNNIVVIQNYAATNFFISIMKLDPNLKVL